MTISQKLTDIYYIFERDSRGLDPVYDDNFKNYLGDQGSALQFAKCVFMIGYEVRDQPLNAFEDHIEHLIKLVETTAVPYLEEIAADDKIQSIYNLGLINMYLYFCKSSDISEQTTSTPSIDTSLLNEEYFEFKEQPKQTSKRTLNELKNVNQSVTYLKKALILSSNTLDISKGIYTYHTLKCLDYINAAFEYYKVDNNDVPIDLDSFYVFTDQLEDDSPLWIELEKQIKVKYGL